MRYLIALCSLMLWVSIGRAGTGIGDNYGHFVNSAFDFHMAAPKTWECEACENTFVLSQKASPREESTTWRAVSPEGTTWLHATFIVDFPAVQEAPDGAPNPDEPDLLTEIQRRHPDIEWYPTDRNDFTLGFTSSPQQDAANEAVEYYLVDKRLVIKLEWKKDGRMRDRAQELENIKRSIDRSSKPPQVISIRSERMTPHEVGDTACFLIEVDDLRSRYGAENLTDFQIQGVPQHWNFKTITWVAERNWFRVCYTVTNAFDADALRVKSLKISNGNVELLCMQSDEEPTKLVCGDEYSEEGTKTIATETAAVRNPKPDLSGPEIVSVELDESTRAVRVVARDESGLGLGEVRSAGARAPIYSDQFDGKSVDITHITRGGWNIIDTVVVFDRNGLPTMLRVPGDAKMRLAKGKNLDQSYFYEQVSWSGQVTQTTVPVLYFLRKGLTR